MKKTKIKLPIEIKSLLKRTQDIVNLYIRIKYAIVTSDGLMAKCYVCGKMWLLNSKEAKQSYHCSHFFREDQFASVRYDHDNLKPSCKRCNKNLHGNLALYGEKLLGDIGQKRFEELCYRKNQIKKWTVTELEQVIEVHKKLLAEPEIQKKLKLLRD